MTRRVGTWIGAGVAVVVALVLLVVLVGLPLYVFPAEDSTEGADVIYVIGPATKERIALAEQLRDEGVADRILVSVAGGGPLGPDNIDACQQTDVDCEHPHPFTTKGEAAMLDDYAAANGVDDAVVLTFAPHVMRTRYIFDQCSDADTRVVSAPQEMSVSDWVYQYGYQTAAFAKAWLTSC